jgi:diguanylate cyclase (GGDEF)-like protein
MVNAGYVAAAGLCAVVGNVLWLRHVRRRYVQHQKRQCGHPIIQRAERRKRIVTDPLTGLPNRDYVDDVLPSILEAAEKFATPVAALMFDIDHFQVYNDRQGVDAGDAWLRSIGGIVRKKIRTPSDRIIYFGNGRFIVILPDSDLEDATHVAERIRHHVDATQRGTGPVDSSAAPAGARPPDSLTISVGVAASIPGRAIDAKHLIQLLGERLHRAKRAGRNTTCYTDDGLGGFGDQRERNLLTEELRQAVVEQEFFPYFQPQLAFESNDIVAYEALVRWRHPRMGLTMPGAFIELAEQTGVIVSIGGWMLKAACIEAQRWPDHIRVAVNVSPVQFERPGLYEAVVEALLRSALKPHRLELELTENVALCDSVIAQQTLEKIKALGVTIALDDFGTGYSSLTYLQRMHFDKLKIDRSFVSAAIDGPHSRAIIRAVIHLAHSLNMTVIAEGVETLEQFHLVRNAGCDGAQGYWIGPPAALVPLAKSTSTATATEQVH